MKRSALTPRRIATDGLMLALALALNYAEHLLPTGAPIPGIKLGLSNIVALVLLYRTGLWDALAVNVLRVVLSNALYGSLFSMLYGLSGGILAVLCMAALSRARQLSPIGVSAAGGVVHNLGQLGCAALLLGSTAVFSYTPVLVLSGVVCGALTGAAAAGCLRALRSRAGK